MLKRDLEREENRQKMAAAEAAAKAAAAAAPVGRHEFDEMEISHYVKTTYVQLLRLPLLL